MFYVFARYRLPLVPFFMLFAAAALCRIPSLVIQARERFGGVPQRDTRLKVSAFSAVSALIVVVVVAVIANWPILSKSLMIAITETNLAVALQAQGRRAEAADHYRRAIAIQPDYAPAYGNLGVTERAMGEVDKAIQTYQQAPDKTRLSRRPHNLANAPRKEPTRGSRRALSHRAEVDPGRRWCQQ
jgi:tetratricopeptide (TPR) repeat protein